MELGPVLWFSGDQKLFLNQSFAYTPYLPTYSDCSKKFNFRAKKYGDRVGNAASGSEFLTSMRSWFRYWYRLVMTFIMLNRAMQWWRSGYRTMKKTMFHTFHSHLSVSAFIRSLVCIFSGFRYTEKTSCGIRSGKVYQLMCNVFETRSEDYCPGHNSTFQTYNLLSFLDQKLQDSLTNCYS